MIKKIDNIQELLNPWINNIPYKKIYNINLYISKIKMGDLFIILQKTKKSKKKYIIKAIKNKASVILYETKKNKHGLCISTQSHTIIIYFKKLNQYIHKIYERFFNYPQKKIKLIGVIGTYGKTTVTHLIAQWKKLINKKIGTIKNLENKINKPKYIINNKYLNHSIQKKLYHLVKKKINISTIELSSNLLITKQISNLKFESVICTTLNYNNLDGQKNMFQKEKIKFSFLNSEKIKTIILNGDENITHYWIKNFKKKKIISVTTLKTDNIFNTKYWINATKIIYNISYTKILFNSTWGSGNLESSLLSDFNVNNILLALATMLLENYSLNILIKSSKFLNPIHRKMEKIKKKNSPLFIINNIHSPQILYRTLYSLKNYNYEKIWCILGYEEIRDISERKIIGNIVEKFSDFVIFINSYINNEKKNLIIKDILKGCYKKNKFFIFHSIKQTIQFIFSQTNKYDMILISEKEEKVKKIIKYINIILKKNF
ncbi:UDP-N-acetylmuramoyl-L-alanyl-D-glutamate--2, 6-diaminopimelate ligase [Buchnera aphidicola (Cinara piceae)]|uniref:UDP-N-acetylmuramoyl-L-alanyl-D-glutamate--2, 6-diaminopimelate ligase n=1 Tax=Buchnera aphidicola (Cinara piceae) TaxID=1660043 RepID=A0A803GCT6_9GAMM|nr:Mur ligase family protein [Buchnera aphidicola]VFP88162.1 UDP-N-acetylmuramoyl-L-alanyl-D-glutamate--2, 6-diaminopimelate ligase [Buchnera aphidicola (Cinara piceae)]